MTGAEYSKPTIKKSYASSKRNISPNSSTSFTDESSSFGFPNQEDGYIYYAIERKDELEHVAKSNR